MSTLARIALPLIAATMGYFLTWFLFGLWAVPLALIVLGISLASAYISEGKTGLWAFVLSLVMVLCLPPFILSLRVAVQFNSYTEGMGSEGVGITGLYIFGILLVSTIVFLGTYLLAQVKGWRVWFPLTPWFFILGVAAFAYAPAVQVDCRYAQTNYFGGMSQLEKRFPWIKAKALTEIPDGAELSGETLSHASFFVSSNCSRDKDGQSRVFSFRASYPLLLAYRESKTEPFGGYAALFDPKTNQKLTRWHRLSGDKNIYALMRNYHPYGLMGELSEPFSRMQLYSYNQVPTLPAEFYSDLKGAK